MSQNISSADLAQTVSELIHYEDLETFDEHHRDSPIAHQLLAVAALASMAETLSEINDALQEISCQFRSQKG